MFEIAPGLVFIHSGKNIGPAGHADRGRVVVSVKNQSVRRELVHIGSHNILVAIRADRIGALVVGKEEDDVGLPRLRPQRRNAAHDEQTSRRNSMPLNHA